MFVYLESATLRGAVRGAHICLDQGGKWCADSDSEARLTGEAHKSQFDAPKDVTIRLHCAGNGTETLPSGGILEMID